MQTLNDNRTTKSKMLVELDALIDFRLGCVRMLYGGEIAAELSNSTAYRNRKSDDLSLIDGRINQAEFALALAKKDNALLDYSRVSLISTYIRQLLMGLEKVVMSGSPYLPTVSVVINHYPMVLSDEDKDLIGPGIKLSLGLADDIVWANLPPAELTTEFLEANEFFSYIMYDFNLWSCAALPDIDVPDLLEMGNRGMGRTENLAIIACKNVINAKLEREANLEARHLGLPEDLQDITTMPWNLLFDFDLIEHVFFTEFHPDLEELIVQKTNAIDTPIDVEVDVVGEYFDVLGTYFNLESRIAFVAKRLRVVNSLLLPLLENIDLTVADTGFDQHRALIAEQRWLTDCLAFLIPSKPAEDFERFFDSRMSQFDSHREGADITEAEWNKKGVRCHRLERELPKRQITVYMTVAAEDCVDTDGVSHRKRDILPSHMFTETILEPLNQNVVDKFKKDWKDDPY